MRQSLRHIEKHIIPEEPCNISTVFEVDNKSDNFKNIKPTGFGQRNSSDVWDGFYYTEENKSNRVLIERRHWLRDVIKEWGGDCGEFLDVGCGWGEIFKYLEGCSFKFKYSGIDICKNTIRKQSHKKHTFKVGNAEDIPFKDNTFDVVWCGETIEHLTNPWIGLDEIKRVTKKGGLIAITCPLDNFNNSYEHTYYITRNDLCTIYNDCTMINYKLYKGSEQCAAFINDRKIQIW